jgi:putative transposase
MANELSETSHSVYELKYHIVWVRKYRYKVLRVREILRQLCNQLDVPDLEGKA